MEKILSVTDGNLNSSNHVLERTARKALVSGRRRWMRATGLVMTHRQAVAQHGRCTMNSTSLRRHAIPACIAVLLLTSGCATVTHSVTVCRMSPQERARALTILDRIAKNCDMTRRTSDEVLRPDYEFSIFRSYAARPSSNAPGTAHMIQAVWDPCYRNLTARFQLDRAAKHEYAGELETEAREYMSQCIQTFGRQRIDTSEIGLREHFWDLVPFAP